ncbi:hypothetical protein NOF55_13455 [Rhizobiaceae bacterium BDR2-2]|uniref:Uncharacterized protein n=1 Tax=Ectorhizobium quercum TaxID=2965071 RepID=A0AAE3N1A2_9HYPH|nr:hypothetical protein [Ectorhizobium quercum]MCX8998112.1 hypothetical protein [Ectorhizobium quercum]
MRNDEAVQCLFEDAVRSDRFVGFARHRPSRFDVHLTLGPCQGAGDDLSIRAGDALTDALEAAERRARQDCVVHDVEGIGGGRHRPGGQIPSAMPV